MKCLNFASYIIRPQNQSCVTIYFALILEKELAYRHSQKSCSSKNSKNCILLSIKRVFLISHKLAELKCQKFLTF